MQLDEAVPKPGSLSFLLACGARGTFLKITGPFTVIYSTSVFYFEGSCTKDFTNLCNNDTPKKGL